MLASLRYGVSAFHLKQCADVHFTDAHHQSHSFLLTLLKCRRNSFVSWRGRSSIMINGLRLGRRLQCTLIILFTTCPTASAHFLVLFNAIVAASTESPIRSSAPLATSCMPAFCRVHVEILVFIFYQSPVPRSRSNSPASSEVTQIFLCSCDINALQRGRLIVFQTAQHSSQSFNIASDTLCTCHVCVRQRDPIMDVPGPTREPALQQLRRPISLYCK